MKNVKVFALSIMAAMTMSTPVLAQDDIEATVSADLVSNYIWRGDKVDNAAIQPAIGLSYKGVSLTAWGSYGITNNAGVKTELDLTLAYTIGALNVGVTDYYVGTDSSEKYLLYNAHKTTHVFEANVGYDFGMFSVQWFTNLAGADYFKADGKRAYSSYFEIAAPFKLGGLDWDAAIGAVPFKANESMYRGCSNSTGFAVTNISLKATKEIKISDSFSLPVFGQLVANPSTQKTYFVLGASF